MGYTVSMDRVKGAVALMHPGVIFLIGMMVGGSVGVLVASLLRAARDDDAPSGPRKED